MNFDVATPPAEQEPHWLTLEEIIGKMGAFIDTKKCEPTIKRREDGLVIKVEYEIENGDGTTFVYTYITVGPRSANTVINFAHFRGNPDDGDYLPDYGTLSNYSEATGLWSDVPTKIDTNNKSLIIPSAHSLPQSQKSSPFGKIILPTLTEREKENLYSDVLKEKMIQDLYEIFDRAEAILGTTDVIELQKREMADFETANQIRGRAKLLCNDALTKLIYLNKTQDNHSSPLGDWNSKGDLTKEQFDDLRLRYKKLSNAIGIMYTDPSTGKKGIRHDLNPV